MVVIPGLWTMATTAIGVNYQIIDVGTFGGFYSIAHSINESGQVAGRSANVNNKFRAFLWDTGSGLQNLGLVGNNDESQGIAINNAGQVVGNLHRQGDGYYTPFLWDSLNGMRVIGDHATPFAINDAGQVVGQATALSNDYCAFLWDETNGMQDLGTLSDNSYSGAYSINNLGQVVGYSFIYDVFDDQAWIWDNVNGMREIGGGAMEGYDINNHGQVVGRMRTSTGDAHAFLWDAVNGIQDLGTLHDWEYSDAQGINDFGQIVGFSESTPATLTHNHAFLYDDGRMIDLNQLLPPDSGWVLRMAMDINNKGYIVGTGEFNGKIHAFLLIPEPATLLLLGFGAVMVRRPTIYYFLLKIYDCRPDVSPSTSRPTSP